MAAVKAMLVEAFVCSACGGCGEIITNSHPTRNPEADASWPCPACEGAGGIPVDQVPECARSEFTPDRIFITPPLVPARRAENNEGARHEPALPF